MAKPVLIVEDDADGQALVSHICSYMNIDHDVAGDAERAGMLLFEQPNDYRLIIIDLALPGKDGWELLAEIRANHHTADFTCVAITAFHTSKTREEALLAGFDAYFAKPIDPTNFARELENLL